MENLMYASDDPDSPGYLTIKVHCPPARSLVGRASSYAPSQLVDFGFSVFREGSCMKTACGTPGCNPRPILVGHPDEQR